MIEILLLIGAIIGGLAVILGFQVRKMLIAKQVDLTDIDAVVAALFDLKFDKAFFAKIAIGTGIGAFGAFASMAALVAGAPADGNELSLIAYGFAWGFAGNGILYVIRLVPEGFITILNLNNQVKAYKARINELEEQNSILKLHVETVSQNGQVPLK